MGTLGRKRTPPHDNCRECKAYELSISLVRGYCKKCIWRKLRVRKARLKIAVEGLKKIRDAYRPANIRISHIKHEAGEALDKIKVVK